MTYLKVTTSEYRKKSHEQQTYCVWMLANCRVIFSGITCQFPHCLHLGHLADPFIQCDSQHFIHTFRVESTMQLVRVDELAVLLRDTSTLARRSKGSN